MSSFFGALGTMAAGILILLLDSWAKGNLAMGLIMTVQARITMTKTVRDMHEASMLVKRVERLLMEVGKGA